MARTLRNREGVVIMSSPATALATRSENSPTNRGIALIADDEPVVLHLGKLMFKQLGFTALTAQDGRQAVDLFALHHDSIRIVILDWTMPTMDGEESFAAIRALDPCVPIILCSGHCEEVVPEDVRYDRHTRFLSKPFSLRMLQQLVDDCAGAAL